MDFFVPPSVVSVGGVWGDVDWEGLTGLLVTWELPISFTSSADPSHMIYIVLKGRANNSGHLQRLPCLSF